MSLEWRHGDLVDVAKETGANVLAFSANAVLKQGESGLYKLVMGAGAAKRVRDYYPGSDWKLGASVARNTQRLRVSLGGDRGTRMADYGLQPDYYLAKTTCWDERHEQPTPMLIVALQVKREWKDRGDLELASQSLMRFHDLMRENPEYRAVMNCPLVGLGGFSLEEVRPVVEATLSGTNTTICLL